MNESALNRNMERRNKEEKMKNLVNFMIGVFVFFDCPEMFFAVEQREHAADSLYFSNRHIEAI